MQLYTKILLGMVVGALIGVLLGPRSALLTADSYAIADGSRVILRAAPDHDAPAVSLPAGREVRFKILNSRMGTYPKAGGGTQERPDWDQVSFKWTKRMALADTNGSTASALGKPKVGGPAIAWLAIENRPVNGDYVSFPERVSGLGASIISYLRPVGTAFMRLIKMVIVPLVFASLLVGVASLGDIRKLGRLGSRTLGLYLCTTAVAVSIGLGVAHLIKPGSYVAQEARVGLQAQFEGAAGARMLQAAESPSAVDTLLNVIPVNPVASLTNGNMLQIIFFAVIFGIALTLMRNAKPVVQFFDKIQEAMIIVIHIVMMVAPFGVAALVADVVGQSGLSVLKALLVYSLTVVIGLLLHAVLVYGGLVRLVTRMPLLSFLRGIRPAQLIAFSTSSSSAALPVTLECAEERLKISNPVASFVIPLGSTVNMDGTALYQGVAALFIAQVFQVDLSLGAQIGIVATATMASIGAAGVPGAGIVTLAMVLTTAGIPTVGVALILGMDRLLDMFRTAVNVTGDLAVTSVMAVSEGEKLHRG